MKKTPAPEIQQPQNNTPSDYRQKLHTAPRTLARSTFGAMTVDGSWTEGIFPILPRLDTLACLDRRLVQDGLPVVESGEGIFGGKVADD
ncbi:MAG: hypothetical protein NTV55_02600 [Planctomycetota bacterium]|nr:hypothetical protein [Planctomycetota bacterium]